MPITQYITQSGCDTTLINFKVFAKIRKLRNNI